MTTRSSRPSGHLCSIQLTKDLVTAGVWASDGRERSAKRAKAARMGTSGVTRIQGCILDCLTRKWGEIKIAPGDCNVGWSRGGQTGAITHCSHSSLVIGHPSFPFQLYDLRTSLKALLQFTSQHWLRTANACNSRFRSEPDARYAIVLANPFSGP